MTLVCNQETPLIMSITVNGEKLLISGRKQMIDCIKLNLENHTNRSFEGIITGDCTNAADVTVTNEFEDLREQPLALPTEDTHYEN